MCLSVCLSVRLSLCLCNRIAAAFFKLLEGEEEEEEAPLPLAFCPFYGGEGGFFAPFYCASVTNRDCLYKYQTNQEALSRNV